jgi:hypothetical protein
LAYFLVNSIIDSAIFSFSQIEQTQQKWPVIEKEAFALHYALQKLDHYLHGAEFIIKTDHKPLNYLLENH